jgi:hypothetical protein
MTSVECAAMIDARFLGYGSTCQDPNACAPTPVEATSWGRIRAIFR